MTKRKLLTLAAAALLGISLAASANQATPETEAAAPAAARPANFFDPNFWLSGFGTAPAPISTELRFNAAHPADWIKFVDPKAHVPMHMVFMNPATYTQFMQPQFYLEFMKPENMAAWMDFNQYQVMMDPATMYHWMNPGSYMHVIDPNMYRETMNPANYMVYMNPATYAGWTGAVTCDPKDGKATQTWFGYTC